MPPTFSWVAPVSAALVAGAESRSVPRGYAAAVRTCGAPRSAALALRFSSGSLHPPEIDDEAGGLRALRAAVCRAVQARRHQRLRAACGRGHPETSLQGGELHLREDARGHRVRRAQQEMAPGALPRLS